MSAASGNGSSRHIALPFGDQHHPAGGKVGVNRPAARAGKGIRIQRVEKRVSANRKSSHSLCKAEQTPAFGRPLADMIAAMADLRLSEMADIITKGKERFRRPLSVGRKGEDRGCAVASTPQLASLPDTLAN